MRLRDRFNRSVYRHLLRRAYTIMKPWQPLRFKVPLDLFLVIGAAYAVVQWLSARGSARALGARYRTRCGLFTFLINLAQTESTGKLRLRAGLNPESIAVAEWITRETPAECARAFRRVRRRNRLCL